MCVYTCVVLSEAWHGVAIMARAIFLQLPDLAFESFAERFVCIDAQNPVVLTGLGSKVFLGGIATPEGFNNARAVILGELDGAVARPAVDYDDFVATAQALDCSCDVEFFVVRDDGGRDLHRH